MVSTAPCHGAVSSSILDGSAIFEVTMLTNILIIVLQSWCEKCLDQWERWKLNTYCGPVYITISRESDGHDYNEMNVDDIDENGLAM